MRVVKIGGSLLDWPELADQLQRFLETLPGKPTALLVGGGHIVDAVRIYDKIWGFDAWESHWWSVELMNLTARMLASQLNGCLLISSAAELSRWVFQSKDTAINSAAVLMMPSAFYRPDLNADRLPLGWQTTSDSIAALLAKLLGADELLLLKSASVQNLQTVNDQAARSTQSTSAAMDARPAIVDGSFESAAAGIATVHLINLRMWSAGNRSRST